MALVTIRAVTVAEYCIREKQEQVRKDAFLFCLEERL